MTKNIVTTDDILLKLCDSISGVLTTATSSQISHAAMTQKITKTSLKPDIGCFVIFDGGFSGLVIINFSANAAMEIYHSYLTGMGMPEEELTKNYLSDEVSNVMGELMNQILGKFIATISQELQTSINQSQPKMLVVNQRLVISIEANLDQPISRRVSFTTEKGNSFYLEFSIDQTEFIQLKAFDVDEAEYDPDKIIEQHQNAAATTFSTSSDELDLFDELGI